MILISVFTDPERDFLDSHLGQSRTELVHLSSSPRAAAPCDPRAQRLVNRPASITGGHLAEETRVSSSIMTLMRLLMVNS